MTFDFIICESVVGKQGEILFVFLFCLQQKGNENYLTIGTVLKSISGMERIKNSATQAWALCPHKWLLNLLFEILNTFTKGAITNRIARKLLLLLGWPKSSCELNEEKVWFFLMRRNSSFSTTHYLLWTFDNMKLRGHCFNKLTFFSAAINVCLNWKKLI